MRVQDYITLIDTFLNGEVPAEDFAVRFQNTFQADDQLGDELFPILEDLFEDAEAYDPMWTPEEENGSRITEPTFRREVLDAREKLVRYLDQRK
jgi:hypothetical protein